MVNKDEIINEIERLIDHYTPYRFISDSEESIAVRATLTRLLRFANGGLDE